MLLLLSLPSFLLVLEQVRAPWSVAPSQAVGIPSCSVREVQRVGVAAAAVEGFQTEGREAYELAEAFHMAWEDSGQEFHTV